LPILQGLVILLTSLSTAILGHVGTFASDFYSFSILFLFSLLNALLNALTLPRYSDTAKPLNPSESQAMRHGASTGGFLFYQLRGAVFFSDCILFACIAPSAAYYVPAARYRGTLETFKAARLDQQHLCSIRFFFKRSQGLVLCAESGQVLDLDSFLLTGGVSSPLYPYRRTARAGVPHETLPAGQF
jgi:hypothetical protein